MFTEFLTKKEISVFCYGYSTLVTCQPLKVISSLRINTENNNQKSKYGAVAVFLSLGLKDNILQTDKHFSGFESFTAM